MQAKLEQFRERNTELESSVEKKEEELRTLQLKYQEKEEAYNFLVGEYNQLTEAVSASFENKVIKNALLEAMEMPPAERQRYAKELSDILPKSS